MLNKDKVRGILRAKQGSQIPKFLLGGPPKLRLFQSPIQDFNSLMLLKIDLLNLGINFQSDFNISTNPNPYMNGSNTSTTKVEMPPVEVPQLQVFEPESLNNLIKLGFNAVGNFAKNNPNLIGAGLDILGGSFSKGVTNSGGVNTAFLVGDTIANGLGVVNPVLGLYAKGAMTLLKGINSIGGKKTLAFSADRSTISQVGGSYGGSVTDINNAASKANKKYGLFSGGARRKADRQINEARRLQNIMTDIADTTFDLRAMAGNDLNYINHQFTINGGYDLRYMRAAKSGMKLLDKIDFIKQKRTINNVINLDTKEVEWEPVIVEEFKEGGNLPELWEPIIEDLWEPIIEDIESYKEGGKTKEELEAPEIEETNQKNLIPEGALHKNKHHMEHTEGLTLKGIPVIDNDREQQAEIELNEIIFTLEVTRKLEELYKEGTDEAAIEAGKLLVKEILFNTDDRTGLIAKCLEGGKLCQTEE